MFIFRALGALSLIAALGALATVRSQLQPLKKG